MSRKYLQEGRLLTVCRGLTHLCCTAACLLFELLVYFITNRTYAMECFYNRMFRLLSFRPQWRPVLLISSLFLSSLEHSDLDYPWCDVFFFLKLISLRKDTEDPELTATAGLMKNVSLSLFFFSKSSLPLSLQGQKKSDYQCRREHVRNDQKQMLFVFHLHCQVSVLDTYSAFCLFVS